MVTLKKQESITKHFQGKFNIHLTFFSLLEKYGCIDTAKSIYDSVQDDLFEQVKNTGVQTNVVFSTTVETVTKFEFDENPKLKTDQNHYVAPTREHFSYGDGSVLVTSALFAGLKWAEDFEEGVAGAKPTTLIDVCSTQKRRQSIFEEGKPHPTPPNKF